MINFSLINFIIQHFLQANLHSIAVFNCWNKEIRIVFSELSAHNFLFTQFIQIDRSDALIEIEERYLGHKQPTLGVFLDLNCQKSSEFTNKSSSARLYNANYRWLIYDEQANLTHMRQLFINANLSVDADVTYAIPVNETILTTCQNLTSPLAHARYFVLYDVYNNGRHLGGKLNMTIDRALACNDSNCQLQCYLSNLHLRSKAGNRCSLNDITMRIATVITELPLTGPPEQLQQYLTSVNNTHIDGIARYGFHLVLLTRDMLNCNLSYTYYSGWSSTEIFGGAISALVYETAELVSTPFLITEARSKYLSPILETSGLRSICLFRTPRNSGIKGGVFLEPFSSTVWIIFGALLCVAALLLWCTFRVEHRRMRRALSYLPSLLTTALIAFGSACFQGTHLLPQSVGGRMAFFSLSLITFLMYNYYTSLVVSSLLGSPVKSRIKTLGQLAESPLEVALEPLPFTMSYLNTSKRADVLRFVQRKIAAKRNPQRVWLAAEEGIKRVRDEPGFVYVFEATAGYAIVEKLYKSHEICDLNEVLLRPGKSLHQQAHRNSSYKEIIRLNQIRMQETGIIQKHRRYWVRSRLHCFSNNFVINVGLEYTAPLFLMLLCAYMLVVFVLTLELGYKRYTDKRALSRQ